MSDDNGISYGNRVQLAVDTLFQKAKVRRKNNCAKTVQDIRPDSVLRCSSIWAMCREVRDGDVEVAQE